ncbi:MAG TPA: response regulator transcription factor [Arenibaculum sp.]|nr:response regulator transcription factor [Arenibaculum sp.]
MTDDPDDFQGMSTVLLDPNRLFREGLRRILTERGVAVMAEGDDIESCRVQLAAAPAPGLVIVDPADLDAHGTGLAETRVHGLVRDFGIPVVVLTGTLDMPLLTAMLRAGVAGYLLKSVSSQALLQSLKLVLAGEKVFPSSLAHHLGLQRLRGMQVLADSGGASFTHQEMAVLSALQDGKNNQQIALALGISTASVRIYMKRLLRKLNVSNRTQAALWAHSHNVAGRLDRGAA